MKKLFLITIVMLIAMTQFASAIYLDLSWVDDASDEKTIMQGTPVTFTYEAFTTSGQYFGADHTVQTDVKLYYASDSTNPITTLVSVSSLQEHNGQKTVTTSSLSEGEYAVHGISKDLDDVQRGEPLRDFDILYFTVVEPNIDPSIATVFIKPDEPYTTDDLKGYCKANDPNGDSITYSGQWIRNGAYYKSATLANQQAGKSVVVDTLASDLTKVGEEWVFACKANDGTVSTAYVFSDPVIIRAVPQPNTAPVITSIWIAPQNPTSAQDIAGFCKPYDADGDSLTIQYQWIKNNHDYSGVQSKNNQASGSTVSVGNYGHGQTAPNDMWTVKCRAYDGEAYSTWKQASVAIVDANTAPSVNNVYINPNPAYENQNLKGYCKISDPQKDNLRYIWAWYKNGAVLESGMIGPYAHSAYQNTMLVNTLSASKTSAGDTFVFSCQAYDSKLYSAEKDSAPVTIKAVVVPNKAPVMENVHIYPSSPHSDDDLKGYCRASDSDDDTIMYEYRWLKNGALFRSETTGDYNQGQNVLVDDVDAQNTAVRDKWQFSCRASDGEDWSAWAASSVVIYEKVYPNEAPVMKAVMITPESPFDNQNLMGHCRASDADDDKVSFTYEWLRNGVVSQSGSTVLVVTDENVHVDTLANTKTNFGDEWQLRCKASDGEDSSGWKYSNKVTIREVVVPNKAPVMNTVYITPAVPYNEDNLEAFCKATDADNDNLQYEHVWYKDSVPGNQGKTSFKLQGATVKVSEIGSWDTRVGESWKIKCRAYDGEDYSAWKVSNVVVIKEVFIPNKAPVMKTVTITPAVPYTDDNLEAFCKATDADNDNLQYEYVWYKDSVPGNQGTTSFRPQNTIIKVSEIGSWDTSVGESWKIKCRAYDGEDYSAWKTSNVVVIKEYINPNLPPILVEVSIDPHNPHESQDLQGLCRAVDQDTTELNYNVVWKRNGQTVDSFTVGPFIEGLEIGVGRIDKSQTVQGDVWLVGCNAFDGKEYSGWMYSDEVVIRDDGCLDNPIAKLDGPNTALVGDTKAYDAYNSLASRCGDIVKYEWFVALPLGSFTATGANSPTMNYMFTQEGTYNIKLKVTDSEGKTAVATKAVVVTSPYVPEPVAVITAPTVAYTDTDFLVSGKNSYAPDGETIVSYEWTVVDDNNVLISTNNKVWDIYNYDTVGQYTYTLKVTASNGESDTTSHTVTVREGEGEDEDDRAYNGLRIVSYTIYGHDYERVAPGETLVVRAKVHNARNTDIEDLRLNFIEPEFGLRYKSNAVDLDAGETDTFILKIDVPYEIEYGYYYPALSFTSDDVKRVKYGYLEVTEA